MTSTDLKRFLVVFAAQMVGFCSLLLMDTLPEGQFGRYISIVWALSVASIPIGGYVYSLCQVTTLRMMPSVLRIVLITFTSLFMTGAGFVVASLFAISLGTPFTPHD